MRTAQWCGCAAGQPEAGLSGGNFPDRICFPTTVSGLDRKGMKDDDGNRRTQNCLPSEQVSFVNELINDDEEGR